MSDHAAEAQRHADQAAQYAAEARRHARNARIAWWVALGAACVATVNAVLVILGVW